LRIVFFLVSDAASGWLTSSRADALTLMAEKPGSGFKFRVSLSRNPKLETRT
jgi:hypothetical protein